MSEMRNPESMPVEEKAPTGEIVNTYLKMLKDPESAIDREAVEKLERQIEEETEPKERVLLRAKLEQAKTVPIETVESNFVEVVKGWATANDVSISALIEEGVPEKILRRAGFRIPRKNKPRSKSDESERNRIYEQLKNLEQGETFTVPMISERLGAHQDTIRKVVSKAVKDGLIVRDGEEASGKGRPAVRYRKQ